MSCKTISMDSVPDYPLGIGGTWLGPPCPLPEFRKSLCQHDWQPFSTLGRACKREGVACFDGACSIPSPPAPVPRQWHGCDSLVRGRPDFPKYIVQGLNPAPTPLLSIGERVKRQAKKAAAKKCGRWMLWSGNKKPIMFS